MRPYPVPANEKQRLKALHDYDILDTITEKEYDAITKIAAEICNVPASMMTLIDDKRQWFKSRFGFPVEETPRELAFCNYTIMDASRVLVVPDMREDERFSANPLVSGDPHAVFYAGAPLVTPDGFVLGSICVLDAKANDLDDNQRQALEALSHQVINSLELRKKIKELELIQQKLKRSNRSLENFARIVSHDMKTPLANISMLTTAFEESSESGLNESNRKMLELIRRSANGLVEFIDSILMQSKKITKGQSQKEVDANEVVKEVIALIAPPADMQISVRRKLPKLRINRTSLQQILQNLITNAIKYNDKPQGIIDIDLQTDDGYHHLTVTDNGMGIDPKDHDKIFRESKTLGQTDRYGNQGTGIGLAAVKEIIESIDGSISVSGEKGKGSVFTVRIPC